MTIGHHYPLPFSRLSLIAFRGESSRGPLKMLFFCPAYHYQNKAKDEQFLVVLPPFQFQSSKMNEMKSHKQYFMEKKNNTIEQYTQILQVYLFINQVTENSQNNIFSRSEDISTVVDCRNKNQAYVWISKYYKSGAASPRSSFVV